MAENKKSFILYCDSLGILDELSDEQCGQLFRLIANYNNPNKPKETQITQVVNLAFYSFKSQFDRDLQKYKEIVERNKKNGKEGGRPKKITQNNPKKPDKDNDSDTEKDKDKETEKPIDINFQIFEEFRVLYKGIKRGGQTEYNNFLKHKDWKQVLPTLKHSLEKQKKIRAAKAAAGEFVPQWKNLSTWINQRCWEDEIQLDKQRPEKDIYSHIQRL